MTMEEEFFKAGRYSEIKLPSLLLKMRFLYHNDKNISGGIETVDIKILPRIVIGLAVASLAYYEKSSHHRWAPRT